MTVRYDAANLPRDNDYGYVIGLGPLVEVFKARIQLDVYTQLSQSKALKSANILTVLQYFLALFEWVWHALQHLPKRVSSSTLELQKNKHKLKNTCLRTGRSPARTRSLDSPPDASLSQSQGYRSNLLQSTVSAQGLDSKAREESQSFESYVVIVPSLFATFSACE